MNIDLHPRPTDSDLLAKVCDCLVIVLHEDEPAPVGLSAAFDAASGGLLTRLRAQGDVAGTCGQTLLLHSVTGIAAHRVLLVGLGNADKASTESELKAARAAAKAIVDSRAATVAWPFEGEADTLALAVSALREADYRFDRYRKADDSPPPMRMITLLVPDPDSAGPILAQAVAVANGVALARDLGNTPPGDCTPAHLADTAEALARDWGLRVEVYDGARIERLGLHAFLAVSRGSAQEPRLIALRYDGAATGEAPVALVGKGVTFDSGGISIKPAEAMDEMKYDMCGAASVLGTLRACAEMQLPINLIGVIVACENMPSGNALKPGDIVHSFSGHTIEVLNTDAEGRLILCDALAWTQQRFSPALTIDIATLTGACVVALGHVHSGLYANDDALAAALLAAGIRAADSAWRMPLDEAYQEQLKSPFADLANIGGRAGGSVTAACFLQRFIEGPWAHLDIAGTAWKAGKDKGSTGRPVPLLTRYLIDRAGA